MVGSKPAAAAPLALSLLACHALGLLSEMTAQAFTLASSTGSSSSSNRQHHHRGELKKHTRYRTRTPAALWAAPQGGYPDGDAWWEGGIDPWTEAESRVSVWGVGTRANTRECVAGHHVLLAVRKHTPQQMMSCFQQRRNGRRCRQSLGYAYVRMTARFMLYYIQALPLGG